MACQICFEDFSDILTEDPKIVRVQQLCGSDSKCTADVCSRCLLQHIQIVLKDCIRGILPRVRCPICLSAIGKAQWIKFVPAESCLAAEYERLAACALSLMPPCCHDATYTHLPESFISMEARINVNSLTGASDPIKGLQELLEDFLSHRVDASRVIALLFDVLGNRLEGVIDNILDRIYDDERRAALYLSYLHRYPDTDTRCCGKSFCFNCKGTQCSEVCEMNDGFDEINSMVRCRKCRVMLVVTDGCDSVDCLCGFEMSWESELHYRDMAAKSLISVDIFDLQLMEAWLAKREILKSDLGAHHAVLRLKKVTRLINNHKSTLRRCLLMWRRLLNEKCVKAASSSVARTSGDCGSSTEARLVLVDDAH